MGSNHCEQLILQKNAFFLQIFHCGVTARFDLLLDTANFPIHAVILVEEFREMIIRNFQLMNSFFMFRKVMP